MSISPQVYIPHVYVPPGLYSPRSMFPQVDVPPGLYSPRSMFPQVYVPPGLYSPRSMFPQVYIPPGLYSPRSKFPQVYAPPPPRSPKQLSIDHRGEILLHVAFHVVTIVWQEEARSRDLLKDFIVYSTIGSTSHSRPLNSLEHFRLICTTMMTNIRSDRDSNLVGYLQFFRATAEPNELSGRHTTHMYWVFRSVRPFRDTWNFTVL